jgi:tRNA pseudouridine55 synthase
MFCWLNIDKPTGVTSRHVVNHIQRLVRPVKVGHAGTLDPLASGVLMIALGGATRLIDYVQGMFKGYRATFVLGQRSDTDDIEGVVTVVPGAPQPSAEAVTDALRGFVGQIAQRPPSFSAVKTRGRRAYEWARRGTLVQLAPRPVTIHEISVVSYNYPQLVLDVRCGKGTYIRALGRDMAEAVGSCAVMTALRRTAIGPFTAQNACSLETLAARCDIGQYLLPAVVAVPDLPRLTLSHAEIHEISRGGTINNRLGDLATDIVACDENGHLAAILAPRAGNRLGPVKNFSPPAEATDLD